MAWFQEEMSEKVFNDRYDYFNACCNKGCCSKESMNKKEDVTPNTSYYEGLLNDLLEHYPDRTDLIDQMYLFIFKVREGIPFSKNNLETMVSIRGMLDEKKEKEPSEEFLASVRAVVDYLIRSSNVDRQNVADFLAQEFLGQKSDQQSDFAEYSEPTPHQMEVIRQSKIFHKEKEEQKIRLAKRKEVLENAKKLLDIKYPAKEKPDAALHNFGDALNNLIFKLEEENFKIEQENKKKEDQLKELTVAEIVKNNKSAQHPIKDPISRGPVRRLKDLPKTKLVDINSLLSYKPYHSSFERAYSKTSMGEVAMNAKLRQQLLLSELKKKEPEEEVELPPIVDLKNNDTILVSTPNGYVSIWNGKDGVTINAPERIKLSTKVTEVKPGK